MPKRRRSYQPQYPWAEYQRKWRAARGQGYNAAYRQSLKDLVKAEKLCRGACIDCGLACTEENVEVFDFDHRDPAAKRAAVSILAHRIAGPDVIAAEMAKCGLRCANCHRSRTVRERHWNGHVRATQPDGGQPSLF